MITIRQLISVLLLSILSIGAVSADDKEKSTATADATFKSLDRDTDERLSKSEAAGDRMLSEHFAAVDADSDGYLTKREYTAHMKEMKSHAPKQDHSLELRDACVDKRRNRINPLGWHLCTILVRARSGCASPRRSGPSRTDYFTSLS
jgi:hypothetical protein